MLSENVTIENGKAEHIFNIPKKWGNTSVSVSAVLTFLNDKIKQPENVKKIYDSKGLSIKSTTIDIPSTIAVDQEYQKQYNNSKNKLIEVSQGLITDITEHKERERLLVVDVTINDVWYSMEKYQKERVIQSIDKSIENITTWLDRKNEKPNILVNYQDSYGKQLINRKIFGGFEILE